MNIRNIISGHAQDSFDGSEGKSGDMLDWAVLLGKAVFGSLVLGSLLGGCAASDRSIPSLAKRAGEDVFYYYPTDNVALTPHGTMPSEMAARLRTWRSQAAIVEQDFATELSLSRAKVAAAHAAMETASAAIESHKSESHKSHPRDHGLAGFALEVADGADVVSGAESLKPLNPLNPLKPLKDDTGQDSADALQDTINSQADWRNDWRDGWMTVHIVAAHLRAVQGGLVALLSEIDQYYIVQRIEGDFDGLPEIYDVRRALVERLATQDEEIAALLESLPEQSPE